MSRLSRLFHLEHKTQPLAPLWVFLQRVWRNFLLTLLIVVFSLALGTVGYHYLGGLSWLDGLMNSAMILTGMGPVDRMTSAEGKLFATFYALYSGLAFLTLVAILIAPIYHRFLHHFHMEMLDEERTGAGDRPPAGEDR
jgi:hypothetical protein